MYTGECKGDYLGRSAASGIMHEMLQPQCQLPLQHRIHFSHDDDDEDEDDNVDDDDKSFLDGAIL